MNLHPFLPICIKKISHFTFLRDKSRSRQNGTKWEFAPTPPSTATASLRERESSDKQFGYKPAFFNAYALPYPSLRNYPNERLSGRFLAHHSYSRQRPKVFYRFV